MRHLTKFTLFLLLAFSLTLSADPRRRAVAPANGPAEQGDALRIGPMTGASVSGTVESINGSVITLRSGGAPAIRVDAASARFATRHDTNATIADVAAGARIVAFIDSASSDSSAPLRAQWILIERAYDLVVTGRLDAVDPASSSVTVLGIRITADSRTVFETTFPTFAPILRVEDLAVGSMLAIEARFDGGKIVAERIVVVSPSEQQVGMLSGSVRSIGETEWIIAPPEGAETRVAVNAETRIVGNPGVGDQVQVMTMRNGNGTAVAVAIVKLPQELPSDPRADIRGNVKSIGPSEWVITGVADAFAPDVTVRITPLTMIYRDPRVGDRVHVLAVRDGSDFVALRISRER